MLMFSSMLFSYEHSECKGANTWKLCAPWHRSCYSTEMTVTVLIQTNSRGFSDLFVTLLPTPTVRIWEPSSLDTQSSWTRCFWVSGHVFPHSMMDLRSDCSVLKLGTANKPRGKKRMAVTWNIWIMFLTRNN